MRGFRRLLGFALYLFMAFPLTLGGMALASLRPFAGDSAAVKSLVMDSRFSNLLRSPDLVELAPETVELGEATLDGKAATAAFQASVPSNVLVSTVTSAVDAAYAAAERREVFFAVDARPLKGAVKAGAPVFADVYVQKARPTPPVGDDGSVAVTLPAGDSGRVAAAAIVIEAANGQPDEWIVGEPGSRFEAPAKMGAMGSNLASASLWLIVTGAGLCFASVMVSDSDWRRRLGKLGARVLVPSAIVLAIGLAPRLFPGGFARLPAGARGASLPDLAEYLRFLSTELGAGFLTSGLIGLGVGTALVSVQRALPPSEEEDLD